ncbi:MAG: protease modulator HflC [Candidatus Hydrogenedentes bacterium]|nr:protease modulator HflC [Candidatus Hydrogenedentota bacterium]
MKNLYGVLILLLLILGLILLKMCAFIVDERGQAVVTRLSKPVHVIVGERTPEEFEKIKGEIIRVAQRTEGADAPTSSGGLTVSMGAGLYFKMPFVDSVEVFPDVLMTYDAEPEQIVLADKKTLVVDNFARWRIENPLLFRISVRTLAGANDSLDDTIYSVVREELGKNDLIEVIRTTNDLLKDGATAPDEEAAEAAVVDTKNLAREEITQGREKIMNAVTQRADSIARAQYGIRVVDVRIKRADLLPENFQAVFGRMTAERSMISKGYRSVGQREANIIKATTDKDVQVILANAKGEASRLRGEADAEVIRIFAEAFSANPDLYTFIRSLEVLSKNTPIGSEFVLGADSGVFGLLKEKGAGN